MSKLFPMFGTAFNSAGKCSVRGAVDAWRIKAMTKAGLLNIVLVELPVPMNKLHACKFIRNLPEFQTPDQLGAIDSYIANNDDGTEIVFEMVEETSAGLTDDESAALEAALTDAGSSTAATVENVVTDVTGVEFPELEAHDASDFFDSLNSFEDLQPAE